ncbi:MAG: T9SS C-terminal target domain-containing protein [Chitinophagia bacterium]|nr:T9SS C-terminal target domain-containing protein [Chitinophagia bacterium]
MVFHGAVHAVLKGELTATEQQLSLATLPAGNYIVKLYGNAGVYVEKLIKQ